MPDALGPTVEDLEVDIYRLRADIESRIAKVATRLRDRGFPSLWLELKEVQRRCPNLPPIPRG